jgi:peptide deformylase
MSRSGTSRGRLSEAEAAARSQAAQREIRVVGDPVLRDRARVVESFDNGLRKVAFRMIQIMRDAPGIGLAAPQLGVQKRLIVYEVDDEEPRILVNPEITWTSEDAAELDEGCLSVPGVMVPVVRAAGIEVAGQDVHGEAVRFHTEGLKARVIQHEVDHLEGVLILDRTGRRERAAAMRELRDSVLAL